MFNKQRDEYNFLSKNYMMWMTQHSNIKQTFS